MPTHNIKQNNTSHLGDDEQRPEQEQIDENNLNVTEQQEKFNQTLAQLTNTLSSLTLVRQQPRKAIKIIGNVGSTTSKKLTEIFEIVNPFKQNVMITEIDLIPDSNFRSNGILKLEANREEFYNSKAVGYFADIGTDVVLIPDGLPLERNESVKFIGNNDDDITEILLSARVQFSL